MEKIVAITYGIWHARYLKVFQDKTFPPLEVSSTAISQLQEFQSFGCIKPLPYRPSVSGNRSNNIGWSPPLRDTLKINVDAHLSSDGDWFAGLILRRPDGSVVGATTRTHPQSNDVVLGEAWGLNDALEWIDRIGETKVIFELDSQILVNAVKTKACIHRSWGTIAHRCALFLYKQTLAQTLGGSIGRETR